ncbi:hypothetical protein DV515_00001741, partial [Chloebia gouldiae]
TNFQHQLMGVCGRMSGKTGYGMIRIHKAVHKGRKGEVTRDYQGEVYLGGGGLTSSGKITSNKKHLESLKNDGAALIQVLENLVQTASSHVDIAVTSLAFEILRAVGHENIKTPK